MSVEVVCVERGAGWGCTVIEEGRLAAFYDGDLQAGEVFDAAAIEARIREAYLRRRHAPRPEPAPEARRARVARLALLRSLAGVAAEVAAATGMRVTAADVSGWERGTRPLPDEPLRSAWLAACGVAEGEGD